MTEGMRETTTVTVFRFDPEVDSEPRYDKFEVPFDENESVLGVLKYIREKYDSTLCFRDSCRIGCCLICTYRVNGKPVVTCRTRMMRDMVIEPINPKKVLKDLVSEE